MTSERAARDVLAEVIGAVELGFWRETPIEDPDGVHGIEARFDVQAFADALTTALAERGYRLAAARGESGLDVERLMEAMNEAFTYEDRDNSQPTLPFVDDVEAFWTPFAAQVVAEYNLLATPTTPEPDPENA